MQMDVMADLAAADRGRCAGIEINQAVCLLL